MRFKTLNMTLTIAILLAAVVLIIASVLGWKFFKQRRLDIVQHPHPLLHTASEPADPRSEETRHIAGQLAQKAHRLDHRFNVFSLGLAAPQIGYGKRVIVLKRSYGDYQVMINPEIRDRKWILPSISTCFSLKGLHILPRAMWVKVRYQDLDGNEHEEVRRGGRATILQQEIDHLNGILVSDYWL
ncbi:MAG: peptide deformylase [Candidatus Peregrinibacteria bacterium Greene0416_19]|nr:MAG: peptide deformylase [Candidatus Peregrinibacteria bacterium Greene0416_19]